MIEPEISGRYANLDQLRAAHNELLRRFRAEGGAPAFVAKAQAFLRYAQATGAILDAESERWAAQGLVDYWIASLDRLGASQETIFLDEFDESLAPELPPEARPYVGLEAFKEFDADKGRFFGRQRDVAELVERLSAPGIAGRLLAVVGPSGSGKSSLVRAGLIPALRRGALPGSERWAYPAPIVPGSDPLAALTRALPPSRDPDTPLLISVDQFEETFTLCNELEQRDAFIARLIELVTGEGDSRVVLTMRSDFEPNVTRAENFYPLFEQAKYSVPPLTAPQLREAIEGPAQRVELKFEDGVVDRLIQDLLGDPAALPLLQFTLLQLWEHKERNRVTLRVYERVGGGRRALAKAADEFYNELTPQDQTTARRILLRMVTPSEGLEVMSGRVRRVELLRLGEDTSRIERVLGKLVEARLVRETLGDKPEDTQIEVAHEALLRNWPTFGEWVEKERVALRRRRRLTADANRWNELERDPGALLRGSVLAEALDLPDLSDLEREFVAESLATAEAEARAEQEARERELRLADERSQVAEQLAAEQLHRADIERRNARRLGWLTIALAVATSVAILFAIAAYRNLNDANAERANAERQSRIALSGQLATNANAALERNPQLSLLLSVEALNTTLAQAEAVAPSADKALRDALGAIRGEVFASLGTPVSAIALSPDGRLLLVAGEQTVADERPDDLLYNLTSGQPPTRLSTSSREAVFDKDGQLYTLGHDGRLRVWTELATAPLSRTLLIAQETQHLSVTPDGRRLVLWGAENDAFPEVAAVSPEPPILTTGYGGVAVVDPQRPADLTLLVHDEGSSSWAVAAVAMSADGSRLAVGYNQFPFGGADGAVKLWELDTANGEPTPMDFSEGELLEARPIRSLAFAPEGGMLAAGDGGGTTTFWNLENERKVQLRGSPQFPPHLLAVSPGSDWQWLIIANEDGSLRFIGLIGSGIAKLLDIGRDTIARTHLAPVSQIAFAGEGRYLVTADGTGLLVRWDLSADDPVLSAQVLRGHEGVISKLALTPDGETLFSASGDGQVRRWKVLDPDNAEPLVREIPDQRWPLALALDADGRRLIVGTGGDTSSRTIVGLWKRDGELLDHHPTIIARPDGTISTLRFSPDGQWLAGAAGQLALIGEEGATKIYLWNTLLENTIHRPLELSSDGLPVSALAFSPDTQWLATGAKQLENGSAVTATLRLWRLGASGDVDKPVVAGAVKSTVVGLAFSPDGSQLYTVINEPSLQPAGSRATVQVWDVAALSSADGAPRPSELGSTDDLAFDAALSPDGRWLAVAGGIDTTGSNSGRQTRIFVWDLNARNPGAGVQRLVGHTDGIWSLAFSPNSRILASAGSDGTVRLWDLADGTSRVLRGHENTVYSVSFNHDGSRLLSGSQDGSARVWDVTASEPAESSLVLGTHDSFVYALDFSPDGDEVITTSGDGQLQIWRLNPARLLPVACRLAGRNMRFDEWEQYMGGVPYTKTCSDAPIHPSLLAEARELASQGKPEEALALMQRAVELQPDLDLQPETEVGRLYAPQLIEMGDQAAAAGEYDAALDSYRRALEYDPTLTLEPETEARQKTAQVLMEQGRQQIDEGDLDAGLASLRRAYELDPDSTGPVEKTAAEALLTRANEEVRAAEFAAAQVTIQRALTLNPEAGDAVSIFDKLVKGVAANLQSEVTAEEALAWLDALRPLRPELAADVEKPFISARLIQKAYDAITAGDDQLALQRFEEALSNDPSLGTSAEVLLAEELLQRLDVSADELNIEKALALYKRAKRLPVNLGDLADVASQLNSLCWFGSIEGFAETVLPICEEAVDLSERDSQIVDSRGVARALTGDYAGAIADFEFFIAEAYDEDWRAQRRRWITALRRGENPFTSEELETLYSQ